MKRIITILLLSLFLCTLTACDSKEIVDSNIQSNNNENIDYVEDTNNENIITEDKLSDIWYSNKIPTTFDELKPYLLDGCWVYTKQNNQPYTQVDIIAFTDFPVMVENEYYQLGNDDYLYANVVYSNDINDTVYKRYIKGKNVKVDYPSIPLEYSSNEYFDKHYYYYNFTFENNQSINDENINICFTRYDEHIEWYLTMDSFDFEDREIKFKGETHYRTYHGNVSYGPWEEVTEIEDNECTFKHFTSIESAKQYIYDKYIEPLSNE